MTATRLGQEPFRASPSKTHRLSTTAAKTLQADVSLREPPVFRMPYRRDRCIGLRIFQAAGLLGLFVFSFILDLMCAISGESGFTAAMLVLGSIFSLNTWSRSNSRFCCGCFGLYVIAMLSLPCIEWDASKAARRLQESIRPGMTEAQVRNQVNRYFPADGRFRVPKIAAKTVDNKILWIDIPRSYVDAVIIYFENGRVVDVGINDD